MRIKWTLWLLPFFLIACGLEKEFGDPVEQTAVPTPEVVIVGPTGDYPDGCQPDEVTNLLLSFFKAYNTGDATALSQVFAEQIEWYSDGDAKIDANGKSVDFFTTYERTGMFPYFASRQEQEERLTLLWLSVVPQTWHGGVGIVYTLRREADDLESGPGGRSRLARGHGAIRCPERKIFVWSMGTIPVYEEASVMDGLRCDHGSQHQTFAEGEILVCAHNSP